MNRDTDATLVSAAPKGIWSVSAVAARLLAVIISYAAPLRFGEAGGHPFATEADALMGGYTAARRMVDDLFSRESQ